MPGQNANTYCGCWLFQYNKGRHKVYIFFPKHANFCEQLLHAACVRESESAMITPGTLAQSGSASHLGWPPQLAVMIFCHWPVSKGSLNSTEIHFLAKICDIVYR